MIAKTSRSLENNLTSVYVIAFSLYVFVYINTIIYWEENMEQTKNKLKDKTAYLLEYDRTIIILINLLAIAVISAILYSLFVY